MISTSGANKKKRERKNRFSIFHKQNRTFERNRTEQMNKIRPTDKKGSVIIKIL